MSKSDIPIDWESTSYDDLMLFPTDAKQSAGFQLGRLQQGLEPTDWKPLNNLGKGVTGVKEIRIWEVSGGYRVAYTAKFRDAITVFHSFKKTTQQTSKKDIELIVKRYRVAAARQM
ncbi:MAG: type II toxin-antitoxin system RelE/ParE family toxin [Pseudomonadales bacterium]